MSQSPKDESSYSSNDPSILYPLSSISPHKKVSKKESKLTSLLGKGRIIENTQKVNKFTYIPKKGYWKGTFSYKLDPRIATSFSYFCKVINTKIGEGLEQAMVEYMRTHKPPGVVLNIKEMKISAPTTVNVVNIAIIESVKTYITDLERGIERKASVNHICHLRDMLIKEMKIVREVDEPTANRIREVLKSSSLYLRDLRNY